MQLLWTQCSREVRVASSSFDKNQLIFFADKRHWPGRSSFMKLSQDSPTVCAATPGPQCVPSVCPLSVSHSARLPLSPSGWACSVPGHSSRPRSAGSPHGTGAGGREAAKAWPSNVCQARPYGSATGTAEPRQGPLPGRRAGTTAAASD